MMCDVQPRPYRQRTHERQTNHERERCFTSQIRSFRGAFWFSMGKMLLRTF